MLNKGNNAIRFVNACAILVFIDRSQQSSDLWRENPERGNKERGLTILRHGKKCRAGLSCIGTLDGTSLVNTKS